MIKISGMTLADPLTGEESVPVIQNGQNKRATTDMFNVGGAGGIETLSLEQLETLIANEEIEFGGHYKVTDKDWLLTGIANNKLVDFAGQGITITQGDTLPVGVEPLILFVDTGVLTGTEPYEIPQPSGYKLIDGDLASAINILFLSFRNLTTDKTIAACEVVGRLAWHDLSELGKTLNDHTLSVSVYSFEEVAEYSLILKYEKLQL